MPRTDTNWKQAQLLPAADSARRLEPENRAASELLAVQRTVREFRPSLLANKRATAGIKHEFFDVVLNDRADEAAPRPKRKAIR